MIFDVKDKYVIDKDELFKAIDRQENLMNYLGGLANLCAGNENAKADDLYQLLYQAEGMALDVVNNLSAMARQ